MRNSLVTNNLKLYKVFVPMCAALVLLSVYYLEHRHRLNTQNRIFHKQKAQFRMFDGMKGVHIFSNVCIENSKIVVYGNHKKANGARITIDERGFRGIVWDVYFRRSFPSAHKNYKYFTDTAFLMEPRFAGNFHHFFIDDFVPLYSVIFLSNRLHPGVRNQILYRTPQISNDGRINSRRTYEELLRTLHIVEFHDVFFNLPNNTCFRQAVIGSNRDLLFRARDVTDHVLSYYNLTFRNNRNASNLYVTILLREDRRIINAEEVLSFAKEVGFQNLRIVDFSGKSIRYQLEIVSTSNVFIGVNGAGLQWSVFMPEGSYLIELSWPNKHWAFYYDNYLLVQRFGIIWKGVGVQDVRLNWTSYAINLRRGVPVSEAEKPTLVRTHPKSRHDNIWKWCDIVVQKNELLDILNNVSNEIWPIR